MSGCINIHTHLSCLLVQIKNIAIIVPVCINTVLTHMKDSFVIFLFGKEMWSRTLFSTIPLGNTFLCLSHIHTQIFAKAFSNQYEIWTIPWLNASYISFSPVIYVFPHWYHRSTSGFSSDTVKIHSVFSESVTGKHFRVWWCPMEKDLQKSPG